MFIRCELTEHERYSYQLEQFFCSRSSSKYDARIRKWYLEHAEFVDEPRGRQVGDEAEEASVEHDAIATRRRRHDVVVGQGHHAQLEQQVGQAAGVGRPVDDSARRRQVVEQSARTAVGRVHRTQETPRVRFQLAHVRAARLHERGATVHGPKVRHVAHAVDVLGHHRQTCRLPPIPSNAIVSFQEPLEW